MLIFPSTATQFVGFLPQYDHVLTKPKDSILRSNLVAHFAESLSGSTTIRAYGEVERFRVENEKRIDNENR